MTPDNTPSPSNPINESPEDDGNIEACIESIADSLETIAAVLTAFAKHSNITVEFPPQPD